MLFQLSFDVHNYHNYQANIFWDMKFPKNHSKMFWHNFPIFQKVPRNNDRNRANVYKIWFWFFSSEDGLYKPWEDKNSTDEENQRAKEAYEAVLTLTASSSSKSAAYQAFDNATRTIAKEKFGVDYEGPVNNFVANFHDAVSFACQNVPDGKF